MLTKQLTSIAAKYMNESLKRLEKCLSELDESEIWIDHNKNLVSIGNLILHLEGNITQYIISGLGGEKFMRKRDSEFSDKPNLNKQALLMRINNTVEKACSIISGLGESELVKSYSAQGFVYTGSEIIIHVVEHLSYHVGQITFAVKYLKDKDLGYYSGIDLDKQNTDLE